MNCGEKTVSHGWRWHHAMDCGPRLSIRGRLLCFLTGLQCNRHLLLLLSLLFHNGLLLKPGAKINTCFLCLVTLLSNDAETTESNTHVTICVYFFLVIISQAMQFDDHLYTVSIISNPEMMPGTELGRVYSNTIQLYKRDLSIHGP